MFNKNKGKSTKDTSARSSFILKVKDLFDPQPQKEKVLRHEDFNRAGDTYYATVSAGYKVMQRVLVLILALFLAFSVITNFREITYDNFFYLILSFF